MMVTEIGLPSIKMPQILPRKEEATTPRIYSQCTYTDHAVPLRSKNERLRQVEDLIEVN
jgi:hypothetical protein